MYVTVCDIRAVFKHIPCLICVLAKKRKEGIAQWKPRKKYKKLRIGKELSITKDWKSSTTKEKDESDAKWWYKPGELLSCDNVGPVNPKSFEGYIQSFIWRDTSTIKRIFSQTDKEASEDVYLEGLEIIRLYYKRHGIKIKVIRSDDFTTFKSRKVGAYYAKYGSIERQSSTPYQHWQNSVERDIQTMIHNISAVVYGSILLMRADSWNRALKHWIKVHNDLPRSANHYSPNAIMDNDHQVDAKYQYRFTF